MPIGSVVQEGDRKINIHRRDGHGKLLPVLKFGEKVGVWSPSNDKYAKTLTEGYRFNVRKITPPDPPKTIWKGQKRKNQVINKQEKEKKVKMATPAARA
jgi:hypothetical protein